MNLPSILCGALALTAAARAAGLPEMNATHPARGEIVRSITLPGTLRANQQATLYAKVSGYLKSLAVDRGDSVKEGQPLGQIEAPELDSDFAKFKAELKVAEIDYARVSGAAKKAPDLITAQSLSEAEGKFKVAQARLEQTAMLLKYSRLEAPFAGVVTQRFVDPGAFIAAPSSGALPTAGIVTIADFATVRLQVAVPEIEVPLVEKGQPASFTVESLPGKNFKATISRIAYVLDEATRTMLVEADVPNPELALRPGMYAVTRIGVEKRSAALLVPIEAVVMEKASAFVFLVADGKARKSAVKLGFNDGFKAEILSGATEQDHVLLVGKTVLADGQPVTAHEVP